MAIPVSNQNIPKPIYVIQMLDGGNIYTWEVTNLRITSEPSNYKIITTNISNKPSEKNIIELEIKQRNNPITRMVLIEKVSPKNKFTFEDPLISWSHQELLKRDFKFTRDFLLTKIEDTSNEEKKWFLTECVLLDSNVWRTSTFLPSINGAIIAIKPKSILPYP